MTSPTPSSRYLLVRDRRDGIAQQSAAPVRRYRLARLRFDGRDADPASRYEHLKRVYD